MHPANKTALVVGARGGIGEALARYWRQSGGYETVFTSSRRPQKHDLSCPLDLADPESISEFCDQLLTQKPPLRLDAIAICSGTLHDGVIQPERRFTALDGAAFQRVMHVNALGPLLLIQQLLPLIPQDQPSQILALSARVGSIADNRLGGWYSYRCSKAALNQGFQTLGVELRRTHPQCVLTLFHPGTVNTALSRPFQKSVPAESLFDTERAAQQLDAVMRSRTQPEAHMFVDWAGKEVPF